MKKKLVFVVGVLLVFGVFGFSHGISQKSPLTYSIPDTKEAKEIMKMIEKAYDIEVEAAYTFNLKKFPTVFINDPRFNVSPGTLETVRQLTSNPSLESAGWLDYKMAYYNWSSDAILHAEELKERANVEKRDLTSAEKKSLVDTQGRIAPARAESSIRKAPLTFLSVEMIEDVATVILDDGPRTIQLTVVLVDKQWYIAGSETLSVHP